MRGYGGGDAAARPNLHGGGGGGGGGQLGPQEEPLGPGLEGRARRRCD